MPASYDKATAIAVLPPLRRGRVRDARLRAWLSRAELSDLGRPPALLDWIVAAIGHDAVGGGEGALRLWGDTDQRPMAWAAAADPVYLEPRLDHLCIHAPLDVELPASDLAPLAGHLQNTLGEDARFRFECLGRHIYLRSAAPIATASASPETVHGEKPNDFLPAGERADAHRLLVSEIEMALHEHPVNHERQRRGLQPINSLWIWGGGEAPELRPQECPTLFADDALIKGYWLSREGRALPWPGDIQGCLDADTDSFVAVAPETVVDDVLDHWLGQLRSALQRGRLASLTLLSRDGIVARVRRSQAVRFWRRDHELLGLAADGA
jgi:hypothetical protein